MRTFAILLILANLGYLAWNLYFMPESETVLVCSPSRQAAETLYLLSEISTITEPEGTESCISLGVFHNTEESDFLVSALLARGLQACAELLQSVQTVNYRVYMPPFNSDTAVRSSLQELQAKDIDSFIISSGELAGGISLGLFTQEPLALGLQENLAGQGFVTSIEEIETSNNEIWVTIEGLSQALLEGTDLLDLLSEGLELEVIEKPCETIASSP